MLTFYVKTNEATMFFVRRYQEEKKDFETRLKELENNLKRKYER